MQGFVINNVEQDIEEWVLFVGQIVRVATATMVHFVPNPLLMDVVQAIRGNLAMASISIKPENVVSAITRKGAKKVERLCILNVGRVFMLQAVAFVALIVLRASLIWAFRVRNHLTGVAQDECLQVVRVAKKIKVDFVTELVKQAIKVSDPFVGQMLVRACFL
jgi:hypothetical protein